MEVRKAEDAMALLKRRCIIQKTIDAISPGIKDVYNRNKLHLVVGSSHYEACPTEGGDVEKRVFLAAQQAVIKQLKTELASVNKKIK